MNVHDAHDSEDTAAQGMNRTQTVDQGGISGFGAYIILFSCSHGHHQVDEKE